MRLHSPDRREKSNEPNVNDDEMNQTWIQLKRRRRKKKQIQFYFDTYDVYAVPFSTRIRGNDISNEMSGGAFFLCYTQYFFVALHNHHWRSPNNRIFRTSFDHRWLYVLCILYGLLLALIPTNYKQISNFYLLLFGIYIGK